MRQIKDCPKCKRKAGWWEKRVSYYHQYHTAEGEPDFASDGFRGLGGARKFCYDCNRDITKCVSAGEDGNKKNLAISEESC